MKKEKSGTMRFTANKREWVLHRPADLETLWDAIAQGGGDKDKFIEDERLPYWVELWPSSFALAAWIEQHSAHIASQPCLDLGCGLGFTALVGSLAGAQVVAFDYELEALQYAQKNTVANLSHLCTQGAQSTTALTAPFTPPQAPLWLVMDWRQPAVKKGSFPFIWAGDIMYERRFAEPVAAFLAHSLSPEGRMWLAEPGRHIYQDFNTLLATYGLISALVEKKQITALEGHSVGVNIWEICRQ